GKKSAQIREILISESAWEEMTCLFAPSLTIALFSYQFLEWFLLLWEFG
ncbi:curli production assembly/transport protein CsgE, partial [Klebsiella pneumoniae]